MDVRNCRRCGKVFQYSLKPICPDCIKQEEDDFDLVRAFLKEYPGSTVKKISDATGISSGQILKFFKDGRLEISEGMKPLLECEKCKKPIFMGRLCSECEGRLRKDVQAVLPRADVYSADRGKAKMHLTRNKI